MGYRGALRRFEGFEHLEPALWFAFALRPPWIAKDMFCQRNHVIAVTVAIDVYQVVSTWQRANRYPVPIARPALFNVARDCVRTCSHEFVYVCSRLRVCIV